MRAYCWLVIADIIVSAYCVKGQSVEINSLDQNGSLNWSAPSGSVCNIE